MSCRRRELTLRFAALILVMVWTVGLSYAQSSKPDISSQTYVPLDQIPRDYTWNPPPASDQGTKDIIKEKTLRILARYAEKLNLDQVPDLELIGVQEWATYVNYDHFVPLTAEGLPEAHGFNFNYYPGKDPKGLAVAEITETGKFVMWWESLAYNNIPARLHERFIETIVSHELGHYRQWQTLALAAMKHVGQGEPAIPRTSKDLNTRAYKEFMIRWSDTNHYRGRELEIYIAQIKNKELPTNFLYAPHIQAYYEGVMKSKWKDTFESQLKFVEDVHAQRR